MSNKWTAAQKDAINSRGGTILVSAAAGSGKTAVLVQRIIDRLTDKYNPGSADRLLVATFTRSAAAEMRMRLNDRLGDELKKDPHNSHIRRQLMLLPTAKIGTTDSFCNTLVRDNFHILGISPDFAVCSSAQSSIMRRKAVEAVIEEMYSKGSFDLLADTLTVKKDDKVLADVIFSLYDFVMSLPFPEKWLEKCLNNLSGGDFSAFTNIARQKARDMLLESARMCDRAIRAAQCSEASSKLYGGFLSKEKSDMLNIADMCLTADWDELCRVEFKLGSIPSGTEGKLGEYLFVRDEIKSIREAYKKLAESAKKMIGPDNDSLKDQAVHILKPLGLLFEATLLFKKKYMSLKKARNMLDFNDIQHLALRLLVTDRDGEICRTELAFELAERFDEILIDEYQDTNHLQSAIYNALSRNGENLFLVGDAKQSIYRFRQAVPEIFMEKLASLPLFDREKGCYPAKILLDSNFRSRRGITDAVNFVFTRLMSDRFGGIDYNDGHALNAAADYPKTNGSCVDLMLIDCSQAQNKGSSEYDRYEAAAIGKKILSMIKNREPVTENGVERPCCFRDFCILLQTRKSKSEIYFNEFDHMGIPVWTQGTGSLFDQSEVRSFLSLLRVFDNPMQDIELLCAMYNPIFGFDDDDICRIKLESDGGDLYSAIKSHYDSDEKCRRFVDICDRYRRLSYTLPTDRLIGIFFEETSYPQIMSAVYDDRLVDSNLRLLHAAAKEFEEQGSRGLCAFLRHVDYISGSSDDSNDGISDGADVVRIMTIHKSKGLEFPICIIADNDRKFRKKDGSSKLLYHQELGCACVWRDEQSLKEMKPFVWEMLKSKINSDSLSEGLRLLYVAMTRAKEKIIFTITSDNIQKLCERSLSILDENSRAVPYALSNAHSFSDWILCCALQQKSARGILEKYDVDPSLIPSAGGDKALDWNFETESAEEVSETQNGNGLTAKPDPHLAEQIRGYAARKYPFESISAVASKLTVSELSHNDGFESLCAVRKPRFAQQRPDSAVRGTLIHRMMQCIDFISPIEDVNEFARSLVDIGVFTDQELGEIDLKAVERFLRSDFYREISLSDRILREYPFSLSVPLSRIEGMPKIDGESVVVEGIVDLVCIKDGSARIVDYKSDRCRDAGEFRRRYSRQLEFYEQAVKRTLGLDVAGKYIYSTEMNEVIELT